MHPQTKAKEIAANCTSIGNYSCLAMCYMYCSGMKYTNELQYIEIVNEAINQKVIDKECTVTSGKNFLHFVAGGEWDVQKVPITSIDKIVNPTPVKYLAEGHGGHWVVVANGEIVFNPLEESYNVEHGKPVDSRVITCK